jgi:hypothetical protein
VIRLSQATAAVARLEAERAEIVGRVRRCTDHDWHQVGPDRGYTGSVSSRDENPAAHGNIEITARCSRCAGERRELINGRHVEIGDAHAVTDDVDARLMAARADVDRARSIETAERAAWRGDVLAVPGATPVRVTIRPYEGGRYVDLAIDGESRCYSLGELEAAVDHAPLDDAQRLAWTLIARRAARVLGEVRS